MQGTKYNGYLSLCAAINRTLSSGVDITDPRTYGKLTEEELGRHLVGDGGVPCPMIPERLRCLKGMFYCTVQHNWTEKIN